MIEREERPAGITPIRAGERASTASRAVTSGPDHYWQYCVTCGTKMVGRKCKLICPHCGFYHSCSEP